MSDLSNPSVPLSGESALPGRPGRTWGIYPVLLRLHFYLGLLVGPFIFVAALTGALYALTPQIENLWYRSVLYTDSQGEPASLGAQIRAAQRVLGEQATLVAVRPAPGPGTTTRVMFAEPGLKPGVHRAIFIDPVTTEPRGDLRVYGTSGVLPLRTWIDHLHRDLLLGEPGRIYSELAASWLWILALGGLYIWYASRSRRMVSSRTTVTLSKSAEPASSARRWHVRLGLGLLIALLFMSVTGLTWSKWAGGNIAVLRASLNWGTPSLKTGISIPAAAEPAQPSGTTPDWPGASPDLFDAILATARKAGIDAGLIEIRPARRPYQAWTVSEIDRSWPTQVDAVAIDPRDLALVDQLRFEAFPLAAKLTRWGIDTHMGILFGLPNQLIVAATGLGLCVLIVWGYRMWWLRRPAPGRLERGGSRLLVQALRRLSWPSLLALVAIAGALGYFLPVLGGSLLLLLVIDLARAYLQGGGRAWA